MPFRYDTEEELEDLKRDRSGSGRKRAAGSDTEIALGTRSLVAIFFGLVLICAVFFGLGYSVGRGSGTRAAEQAPAETAAIAPDNHLAKPSAEQALTPVETQTTPDNDRTDGGNASTPDTAAAAATSTAATATPVSTSAPAPSPGNPFQGPVPTAATQAARAATLQPAVATVASGFMVQVAAVRVPQDAQILVEALKKRGYPALVRNEPQDQLLHIQVGPYAARTDAVAMRAKLLSDGYNAVVK
jgi:DedD protein